MEINLAPRHQKLQLWKQRWRWACSAKRLAHKTLGWPGTENSVVTDSGLRALLPGIWRQRRWASFLRLKSR